MFIIYDLGLGSKNRVEFISLWTLLETEKSKDVRKLQVLGDSNMVTD